MGFAPKSDAMLSESDAELGSSISFSNQQSCITQFEKPTFPDRTKFRDCKPCMLTVPTKSWDASDKGKMSVCPLEYAWANEAFVKGGIFENNPDAEKCFDKIDGFTNGVQADFVNVMETIFSCLVASVVAVVEIVSGPEPVLKFAKNVLDYTIVRFCTDNGASYAFMNLVLGAAEVLKFVLDPLKKIIIALIGDKLDDFGTWLKEFTDGVDLLLDVGNSCDSEEIKAKMGCRCLRFNRYTFQDDCKTLPVTFEQPTAFLTDSSGKLAKSGPNNDQLCVTRKARVTAYAISGGETNCKCDPDKVAYGSRWFD